jgi:uncharacterized membrane protein YbhN (UPF0104 family)
MHDFLKTLKPLLRWIILGTTLFFLAKVLKEHWQGVATIRLDGAGWACLAIALGVTLLAHISAGWVWGWMLQQDFHQPLKASSLIQAYLQTNIAKYIPGNIWHYYGRITAATKAGASLETATVSTLLEPLLMAAAAFLVALLSHQAIAYHRSLLVLLGHWFALVGILVALHPRVLNPVIRRLGSMKQTASQAIRTSQNQRPVGSEVVSPEATVSPEIAPEKLIQAHGKNCLDHYPWIALLGELGFLLLRGSGFLITFFAIRQFDWADLPLLLSAFSVAWVLGLVVPGAPGGVGIFEATAIALLRGDFPTSSLIAIVALYRLVSVVSEALGAGLGWLDAQA